jgi:hypothetical protein
LTIAQEGRDLVVRLRREGSDLLGIPPFVVADVFDEGQRRDVIVAISKDSLSIRIDERRALIETFIVSPMSFWNSSFNLALGNEFTWERPWLGEISKARVTLSDKEIDLLCNTSSAIVGYGLFFLRRFQFITQGPFDALLNLIAMVPIGFLTMSVIPTARLSVVLGWWAGLCIFVEILQAFIVGRYPCFSDAALNVVGMAIGALLLNRLRLSTKHTKTPS